MTTYLLILWLNVQNSAAAMTQVPNFTSKEACEAVGQQFEHHSSLHQDRGYVCLEVKL